MRFYIRCISEFNSLQELNYRNFVIYQHNIHIMVYQRRAFQLEALLKTIYHSVNIILVKRYERLFRIIWRKRNCLNRWVIAWYELLFENWQKTLKSCIFFPIQSSSLEENVRFLIVYRPLCIDIKRHHSPSLFFIYYETFVF